MKINVRFLLLLIIFVGVLYAVDVPETTENKGLGKHGRINQLEKNLISLAKEVQVLKQEVQALKSKVNSL